MKVLQNIKSAYKRLKFNFGKNNNDEDQIPEVDWTRDLVRCALDNSQLIYAFDSQNDNFCGPLLPTISEAVMIIQVRENYILALSCFPQMPLEPLNLKDALLFCNKWNSQNVFPKAHVDEKSNLLVAELGIVPTYETTEKSIRRFLLNEFILPCILFWKEVEKYNFMPRSILNTEENGEQLA